MFRGADAEARMEEEFQFHIEMETRRLVETGMTHADALRQAIARFGGIDAQRESMRDGRGARALQDLAADARYAVRALRKSPGFAIAVALTLGIGIGMNGMVFGYVNSMLMRPLPARDADRLVGVFGRDTRSGNVGQFGYEDYVDFRDRSGAFAGLAGVTALPLNLAVSASAGDMVWGEMVTENFFSVLDMQPAAGRFFTAADAPQGANQFAVLSYESWVERFGRDPGVVGRVVRINGTPFTITGVAPRGFRGIRLLSFWPEIWVPIGMHAVLQPGSTAMLQGRGGGSLMIVGRMRPGLDRERTAVASAMFARQLETQFPATNANVSTLVVPARVGFESPNYVKPTVLVLASAFGIVASLVTLLVICANLANLQLARVAARGREIAIRLSLGCSRGRLTRQLLVESAVLALPGVAVAAVLTKLGEHIEPYLTPRLQFQVGLGPTVDARVTVFTALTAIAAIVLVALLPALRAGRPAVAASLTNVLGAGASARAGRPSRLRSALVVGQLALTVVLLVGGTLFVRSLLAARSIDVGFDARNRSLVSINVGLQGYDATRGLEFYDKVLARVRDIPEVHAAAFVFPAPFDTHNRSASFYIEGLSGSRDGLLRTDASFVSQGFVAALGLRLESGRDLTAGDSAGAPRVMLVSRSLATRLWPGRDPLGQRARRGGADGPEITVVGVLSDATFAMVGPASAARAYIPVRQEYRDWETLVVQTRGDASRAMAPIRSAIATLDPALPTFGATTMTEAVSGGFAMPRSAALVSGFFGLTALVIAAIGLYAIVAGSVVERTREVGLRMALGSTPAGVVREMMRAGARLGIIGVSLGLVGALGSARAMSGLLFGLSSSDPVTFIGVPVFLAVVMTVATYLPARRAARLDPMSALRSD